MAGGRGFRFAQEPKFHLGGKWGDGYAYPRDWGRRSQPYSWLALRSSSSSSKRGDICIRKRKTKAQLKLS